MLTGLAILWIVDIALFVWIFVNLENERAETETKIFWGVAAIVVSIILSSTVSTDLASRDITPNRFFLWGVVTLGALSLIHFFLNLFYENIDFSDFPGGGGCFSLVITLVGFISSVIGIIAFYLEYLR